MSQSVGDLTERELIARIQGHLPLAPRWMTVGIGDDAAVVEPERNRLEVLSVDALVEGVHFDCAFTPPDAIGHRALAVNLSDLAAMGAAPRLALLSLALPPAWPLAAFDGMIAGLTALAARHGLHVAGGNLTRSPGPLVVDVTVVGSVKRRRAMTRVGARPGDELYVTGSIGAAAAGLQKLKSTASTASTVDCRPSTDDSLVRRFLFPEPRVRMGLLLARNRAATACIDLSDGLADGIHQIARVNQVGAIVEAETLPIEPAVGAWFDRQGRDAVTAAVTGGDDYELLVAVRPRAGSRLAAARRHGDVPLTRVGVCTKEPAVLLRRSGAKDQPLPTGYSHFR